MRELASIRSLVLLVLLLSWPARAGADRVDRLVKILKTSDSYKVRLQVVITLGKLKDRRAVPALIGSLGDDNYTVRGVAATALGQIRDPRAKGHLKRLIRTERNSFVKSQAKKALAALKRSGGGPPAGSRFFITVKKVSNNAGPGGKKLAEAFRSALLKEFSHVPGVAIPWAGKNPSAKVLRKHRLKGFALDGSILKLGVRGGAVSCSIKVSLSTYPGNSMKAFYSGGASMDIGGGQPSYRDYKDIVEGAAQGARQHIAASYLSRQ